MSAIRLLVIGLILMSFASVAFAWVSYVPETYQTNQVAGPIFYKPSTPYQGWNYYSYYPNSGYPVMGGGRYYPPGYMAGSYAAYTYPSYNYNSYNSYNSYGPPVHTTLDFYYKGNGFSIGCSFSYC